MFYFHNIILSLILQRLRSYAKESVDKNSGNKQKSEETIKLSTFFEFKPNPGQ